MTASDPLQQCGLTMTWLAEFVWDGNVDEILGRGWRWEIIQRNWVEWGNSQGRGGDMDNIFNCITLQHILTQLVGRQEGHSACKKLDVGLLLMTI